jgi:hypothetical protein
MEIQQMRAGSRRIDANLVTRGEEKEVENRQRRELEAQQRCDFG